MKIFGLDLGEEKPFTPLITNHLINRDESSTIRPELKGLAIPEAKKPANIAPVKSSVLSYASINGRRGEFNECEYDLPLINRIIDTDSYCHQAFLKKTGLMFKEGFEFVGPNPKTIQYIKLRFDQIARATGIPNAELLRAIGNSLVSKANAFLVKVRKESASGGRTRNASGSARELEPIAGYFIAPAETMQYEADKMGRVTKWKQELPDGNYLFFKPEDVVHIYFNKKEGFVFGTPTITPVVDDIRSLRKIEENIELLVYQHLFPLFHYKIGSDQFPATIDEQGNDEIEVARTEIRSMPSEGGVVTSHRHEIQLIGAENRSLRAEGYLDHFKKRVFSGLGISAVDMGEGECYSADTQTLTENGWKYHWQIDHTTERIGTYNPDTNRVEFHLANYKHESFYSGKMIHFKERRSPINKSNSTDILVTPSHDMWVMRSGAIGFQKIPASEVKPGNQLLLSAKFQETRFTSELPDEIINDWYTLAGYVYNFGKLESGQIVIQKRSKKLDELISILDRLAINYDLTHLRGFALSDDRVTFSPTVISNPDYDLTQYLSQNLILETILNIPVESRNLFLLGILNSFPYKKSAKYSRKSYKSGAIQTFRITDPDKHDILQLLALSAGHFAEIEEDNLYIKLLLKAKHYGFLGETQIKSVNYSGTIYCYNVPNHLFLTRRNGKVAIAGNTANRSTSDSMSRNLVDSVKDIQRIIESQFTEFVINELLLESTFGADVLNTENRVQIRFKEIDLDYQIKKEAHYADQFTKNTISQHEARIGMGRQPMAIPPADEVASGDTSLPEKYPEWYATQWKLISEPQALIQSIDEQYSAAAKAAAENRATSITPGQSEEAATEQTEHEVELEKEKGKAKVAIARMKPRPAARKDSFLVTRFNNLEEDTVRMISTELYSQNWFRQIAFLTETEMIKELRARSMTAFNSGYQSILSTGTTQIQANIRNRSKIETRVNFYVNRLVRHTIQAIQRQNIDHLEKGVKIQKVKAAFEALRFRNDFIEDVEIRKAYNLGVLEAARDTGRKTWTLEVDSSSCEGCKLAATKTYMVDDSLDLDTIPPLHANSRSRIKLVT